jgi:hypothetical protein
MQVGSRPILAFGMGEAQGAAFAKCIQVLNP